MKTLFYGTPEAAVPFLELLAQKTEVLAVVSQPDRPAGRSLQVAPTPVKKKAQELGLRVLQPSKPSEIAAELAALGADLAVAVAYGRILRKDALSAPKLGTLNVHFSLLPHYRGAAPVQWALAKGETRSGVTVFWLDEGMDTGPIFAMQDCVVGPDDDAPALMARLQELGVHLLSDTLDEIARGELIRTPQPAEGSLAPLIEKEDARLDLGKSAHEVHNTVRAFVSWPKAYLELRNGRLIVLKTKVGPPGDGRPGTIVSVDRSGPVLIQCGLGSRLQFLSVQPEGKKPVSAADYLNGLRMSAGDVLPIIAR